MAATTNMFVLFSILWFGTATYGVDISDLPHISCPQYFRYYRIENGFVGFITLEDVPSNTFNVEGKFSQKQPLTTSFRGSLAFEPDLITVQKNFENGSPITFKVMFPLSTEVPKLIRITINNKEICSADIPTDHKVFYSLQRSFTASEGTQRKLNINTPSTTETTENNIQETVDSSLCGLSTFNPMVETLGNHVVKWGWFPWATKIYRSNISDVISNGVLISARTVITTAHSFESNYTMENIQVLLGALGLNVSVDSYPVTRGVKTFLIHPEFGKSTHSDADIVLLQLDAPVKFSVHIIPICLMSEAGDDGTLGTYPSWGYAGYFGYRNEVDTVMFSSAVSNSHCLSSNINYTKTISPRTFCTYYYYLKRPRYSIDRGTGMIIDRNGYWTLFGLYSSCLPVNGKCIDNDLFVYVNVVKFYNWIYKNMWI